MDLGADMGLRFNNLTTTSINDRSSPQFVLFSYLIFSFHSASCKPL